MLTGHPDEAANNSNTPPPLLEAPFQVRFHAYVLNVWTARQRFQGSEYCKLDGFLDTSASHMSEEQSYTFSNKISKVKPPRFLERTKYPPLSGHSKKRGGFTSQILLENV